MPNRLLPSMHLLTIRRYLCVFLNCVWNRFEHIIHSVWLQCFAACCCSLSHTLFLTPFLLIPWFKNVQSNLLSRQKRAHHKEWKCDTLWCHLRSTLTLVLLLLLCIVAVISSGCCSTICCICCCCCLLCSVCILLRKSLGQNGLKCDADGKLSAHV